MITIKNSTIGLEVIKMIGERIRMLREEKNLTQQDLAEAINSTQQKISNYEKGPIEPDYETLKSIADFFGTTTDYLLGRTNVFRPIYLDSTNGHTVLLSNLPEAANEDLEKYLEFLRFKYLNYNKMNSKE